MYPDAFMGVGKNRIRNTRSKQDKVNLRVGKYDELKSLWENINQKVILEYNIKDENKFEALFKGYLEYNILFFKPQGVKSKIGSINFEKGYSLLSRNRECR